MKGNLWIGESVVDTGLDFLITPGQTSTSSVNFLGGGTASVPTSQSPDTVTFSTVAKIVSLSVDCQMEINGQKKKIFLNNRHGNTFTGVLQ